MIGPPRRTCQAPDCDKELPPPQPGARSRYCSAACRQAAARARAMDLTEKRCAACKQVKPIKDFQSPYRSYCRECNNTRNRAHYAEGKPYLGRTNSYRKNLGRRYGITFDEYQRMAESQNDRCAICGEQPENRRLHVDHDHASGRVRELLCGHCNKALSGARDNPALLHAMIAYLDRHQETERAS